MTQDTHPLSRAKTEALLRGYDENKAAGGVGVRRRCWRWLCTFASPVTNGAKRLRAVVLHLAYTQPRAAGF